MRQITITCTKNSAVADSYNAGYQGEHNATQLLWQLPEDLQNYNYILAFALPSGETESVIIDKYPIVYSLSQTITQLAGTVTVQLTVLNDGEIIYKTQQVQLRITNSINIDSTAKPYVSELTQAIEQFIIATKSLDNISISAERKDNCVTVSITDKDNNTSTYNIFDGSDYVLTDDDKQEIATVVTGDLSNKLDSKQDKLVTGENIKTVNNQSLLGEGNIKTEKEYKRAYVKTTEEVKQIFLETDDFDVCFISINTNRILCKFKPSYYYKKATSSYKIYAYTAAFTAQYSACLKIEKHPATFPYNDCSFRIYSNSIATMNPVYTTAELKNGITITVSSDADVFPVGTTLEVYYK